MLAATAIAWFWAFAQVSTRIARPWQRLHCRAASPAQKVSGAAVRPQASTAIPPAAWDKVFDIVEEVDLGEDLDRLGYGE